MWIAGEQTVNINKNKEIYIPNKNLAIHLIKSRNASEYKFSWSNAKTIYWNSRREGENKLIE